MGFISSYDAKPVNLSIRRLQKTDPEIISQAFASMGWRKPIEQYQQYYAHQEKGKVLVLVAELDGEFAGYLKINWHPDYTSFPEVQDLNVLSHFRRRGIATALMDKAEALIAQRSKYVGIGVGLHPGYNAAQRMYVLRGYVPDGKGVTWRGEYIKQGQALVADDGLVLHLAKDLQVAS